MLYMYTIHGSLRGQEKAALERDPTLGMRLLGSFGIFGIFGAKWTVNMCMFKATKKDGYLPPTV